MSLQYWTTGLRLLMLLRLQRKVSELWDSCVHAIHSLTSHLLLLHHHASTIRHLHALSCSQRTSLVDFLTRKFVISPQQLGVVNTLLFLLSFFFFFLNSFQTTLRHWNSAFQEFCVAQRPHCSICKRKTLFSVLCLLALRRTYFLYFCLVK